MAEFPAIPLWTDAYLSDTRHLTAAQHGAYLLLMFTAWRTKDNSLPDDDDKLSSWAAMDKRTWLKNKKIVMSFWCKTDGVWRQKRLDDERKRAEHVRNCQVQAGLASALKRKETQSRHVGTELPTALQPPSPSPSPIPSIEGNIPPIVPPKEKSRKEKKNGKTGYPEGFEPDIEAIRRCSELGLDLGEEERKFRDWTTAGGYIFANWQAAFRNHLNRASERRQEREQRASHGRQGPRDVVGAALRATEILRQREN